MALTDTQIKNAKPSDKPYEYLNGLDKRLY